MEAKFTKEERQALDTLRLLIKAEWSSFGTYLSYNSAMNIVGLATLKRAVKCGMVAHFVGPDWVDWTPSVRL